MVGTTAQLCAEARRIDVASIPEEVRLQARRTLLNFVGCALGGAGHDSVSASLAGAATWAGPAIATVLGRSAMADPLTAAMANGISSAVYSFDDTHAQALVHPGGPVAAALLALAETQAVSGAALMRAFILGAELVCRLSMAISVAPAVARREWVQTGVCGGPGAALAAGLLMDLDAPALVSAIGLAACRASGYRGLTRSMCFSYMAGAAAQSGLSSASLARAGMTGPLDPLIGEENFGAAFAMQMDEEALFGGWGARFELLRNTFKPYPCGVVIHPVIDACLALRDRHGHASLARVEIHVHPATASLADIAAPRDQFDAQMSLQHWATCALARGRAGVEEVKPDALCDASLLAMREKVDIRADASLARNAARVRITTTDGRSLEEHVLECRGSAGRPMSDIDLDEKFLAQAVPALGEARARELIDLCRSIETLADASIIARAARP